MSEGTEEIREDAVVGAATVTETPSGSCLIFCLIEKTLRKASWSLKFCLLAIDRLRFRELWASVVAEAEGKVLSSILAMLVILLLPLLLVLLILLL